MTKFRNGEVDSYPRTYMMRDLHTFY